tara:strand:+ start:1142 stop:1627 length:486 start_codon:yes stop_codon:yes gene_type:complete
MTVKKIINIVLIISVVAIWSIVGYRFFTKVEVAPSVEFQTNPSFETREFNIDHNRENLIVSKKNPFNKNQARVVIGDRKPIVKPKKETKKADVSNKKPNMISYHGSLTDNSGHKIYIIKINRQMKRFKKGQKIGDVTLLKIIENGVLILDRDEKKEIFEKE